MKKLILNLLLTLIPLITIAQAEWDDPITVTDWNQIWKSSFIQSLDAVNLPESGWFWGLNMNHSSNNNNYRYNGQIAIKNAYTNPTMYFRSTGQTGIGTWTKVLHSTGDQFINGRMGIGISNIDFDLHLSDANANISLGNNIFINGHGTNGRIANNAYYQNGWNIFDSSNHASTIELRDTGVIDMYGTLSSGQLNWQMMFGFDAPNNKVYFPNGNVGIGLINPFFNTENEGLHINKGDHTSILLGSPKEGYGGIIQTSDNKRRIFIGANLYDDKLNSWKSFTNGNGSAGISIIADEGGWGTGIDLITSVSDGHYNASMSISGNGNVGIGTTSLNTEFKLAVAGKIRATEIKVEATPWPDYVFLKNYNLITLEETESFIKKEGHLPNLPSAAEVKEYGISLGEMNAKLLEKIEELTLHLINQNKKMEVMEKENIKIQKRLETLESK